MARIGGSSHSITPDTTDGIVVSDATGAERVLLGNVGNGDYGLKVTSSDGSTVIIDGTSNMFKILVTGTMTVSAAANGQSTTTTTLTALGTFATTPSHHSHVAFNNTDSAGKYGVFSAFEEAGTTFAAATSGGAVTRQIIGLQKGAEVSTSLDGSFFCVVTLWNYNQGNGSISSRYCRYYVQEEAAL
jgi:hypothetical protein